MQVVILSAFIGLVIGLASTMFSRTQTTSARLANVASSTFGSIILTILSLIFGISAPIPAVAVVGALAAIMVLVIFRKPSSENRSYYL